MKSANRVLIADSGSTKTDWAVIESGVVLRHVQTKGMNPYLQTPQEMAAELCTVLLPQLNHQRFDALYFYGAGCVFDKAELMKTTLGESLQIDRVEVHSDLLAAGHATCGRSAGIVAILGTGSNSCFYNGTAIEKNIPPLGFILGDEGGGALLGCMLVGDVLKEIMPPQICKSFFDRFKLTQAEILDGVYKRPFPNRFLASFSPFIQENIHLTPIRNLVKRNFDLFFERNIKHYTYTHHHVHCVGSIAYHYQELLEESAHRAGAKIGTVIKSPMEQLINYYGI